MNSLLLATRNPGKLREIQSLLGDIDVAFSSLRDFEDVGVAPETGATYAENAIAKAEFYAAATGTWALADDSGLEVKALGGAPGVFSARYAGENASDAERRLLLVSELKKLAAEDRSARFVCVVAIARPSGEVIDLAEGICEGMIAEAPRGESGFGYDPLFVPDGYEQTFAELAELEKNRISHRARALLKTREFLASFLRP